MAEGKKHFMSELVAPHLQMRLLGTDRLMIGTKSPGRPCPGGRQQEEERRMTSFIYIVFVIHCDIGASSVIVRKD